MEGAEVTNPQEAPKERRPTLNDSKDFIHVDMNSYGVTKADREPHILETTGLGPCVGVALYEPTKKIAGLLHVTTPLDVYVRGTPLWQSVQEDIVGLLFAMQRNGLTTEDRAAMQASLIGGENNETMIRLMPIVQERLKQLGIPNIVLSEEGDGTTKDFAIDARDGKIYDVVNVLEREVHAGLGLRGSHPKVTSDKRSLN